MERLRKSSPFLIKLDTHPMWNKQSFSLNCEQPKCPSKGGRLSDCATFNMERHLTMKRSQQLTCHNMDANTRGDMQQDSIWGALQKRLIRSWEKLFFYQRKHPLLCDMSMCPALDILEICLSHPPLSLQLANQEYMMRLNLSLPTKFPIALRIKDRGRLGHVLTILG